MSLASTVSGLLKTSPTCLFTRWQRMAASSNTSFLRNAPQGFKSKFNNIFTATYRTKKTNTQGDAWKTKNALPLDTVLCTHQHNGNSPMEEAKQFNVNSGSPCFLYRMKLMKYDSSEKVIEKKRTFI